MEMDTVEQTIEGEISGLRSSRENLQLSSC